MEYLDESDGVKYGDLEKVEAFDCFLFTMMSQTQTEFLNNFQNTFEFQQHDSKAHTPINAQEVIENISKEIMVSDQYSRSMVGYLCQVLFQKRNTIVRHIEEIKRASLDISTHKYQRGLMIRELDFHAVQKVGQRTRLFFKVFAEHSVNGQNLMEALCTSPEQFVNICRIL